MNDIRIGQHLIGPDHPPFIIAEMSGNHGHDLDKALRLVEAAAAAGAQALKLQTYTADTMTLDIREGEFFIDDPSSLWRGHSLYELYQKAHTPWEWHAPIFERACQLGLEVFSTPFDASAVEFLESLGVPCYKIASFENGDLPLIRQVASTGKPLIMSTGTATLAELVEAVAAAREAGCRELVLLKCTSSYPAEPTDAHLLTLPHMAELFNCQAGLSDHTLGTAVAVASVALGARVIEKHFTLDRAEADVDAAFSLEPQEFAQLVKDTHLAWQALGKVHYGPTNKEKKSRRFRRSLYIARDMEAGERLTLENLACVRPGEGLAPRYLETVLGRTVNRAVKKGTPLSWKLI
ncbi:pseudaminic acid synthase [Geoalkalibacter halelectricus]|uniref:Pseudaminic acid synthase n=1 Tax=Geoalkalibacter halelectricus TaxID=2847045 RepID=A0ABY5ZRP7_9BACT|nr:pseudaminic acid synthase [Geoalkalibacter halelectricus]MDO3377978.1 pseudaminic acid synthase [Geoalkalibacter halelectricus]UWZ81519.1 pseudaminic acid synthase [Geoalkalibacter halelectricus]